MAKDKLSGAREAPLYPKSSGVSATNENQMVATAAFQWYYSEDKKTIYVVMTDGYVFNISLTDLLFDGELVEDVVGSIAWPIGSTYFQLPGKDAPDVLGLPGEWTDISSEYEGRFFRVAGGNGGSFGDTQEDAFQHFQVGFDDAEITSASDRRFLGVRRWGEFLEHSSSTAYVELQAKSAYWDESYAAKLFATSTTLARTATETRPVNRTIKVWERTA